jgi:hypothetical protein
VRGGLRRRRAREVQAGGCARAWVGELPTSMVQADRVFFCCYLAGDGGVGGSRGSDFGRGEEPQTLAGTRLPLPFPPAAAISLRSSPTILHSTARQAQFLATSHRIAAVSPKWLWRVARSVRPSRAGGGARGRVRGEEGPRCCLPTSGPA